ncbi:MAG: hypothetical protein V9E83_02310 [Baekduia sp.]
MLRRTALLTLIAAAAAAPAAQAGTSFPLGTGSVPDVLTDPVTGAGRFVWAEDDYTIKFCSVAAGTQTCSPQTIWQLPAAPANAVGDPKLLRDTDGTLYIFLHRYVPNTKWLFKSTDNGATWNGGAKIYDNGSGTNVEQPVFGPGAGEITTPVWNPGRYVASVKLDGSESTGTARADLQTGSISALVYDFHVANDGAGGLVAVAQNLGDAYSWSLTPSADPSLTPSWSSAPALVGKSGDMAFGGSRTGRPFMLSGAGPNVVIRKFNGAGFDPPRDLETETGYMPAIGASPGGTVAAAYRLNGSPARARVAVTTDGGATFAQRTFNLSDSIYSGLAVSPNDAGDGWAVWREGTSIRASDLTTAPGADPSPAPAPTPTTPITGGIYGGTTTKKTVSDKSASYTLSGVPKECVNPGATFKVKLGWTRKKRKGNLFVKVRRTDFYIGSKRVKIDKKAPFAQTLTVTITAPRGSTQTVRARAYIKVRRGKSPTKSIRATFKVCA